MDEAEIRQLCKVRGYGVSFTRYQYHSGNGRSKDRAGHYVNITIAGKTRVIGKFETGIALLDEEQFVARVEKRFAQPARKGK